MKRTSLAILPKKIQDTLVAIGAAADKAGVRAYLVGGMVRDLLLGVASSDIDVVIEGDALALANTLATTLKARILLHEAFRTASLILKDGMVLDVVTARRETYAEGGALPTVVPSTIKDDLMRRDFTINAIAIGLNKDNFGVLRDDAEGVNDVQGKLIRIMHEKSFVDDPTRILRAARYGVRFGFQFDALTQDLLDQAVALDVFKTISPTRYYLELSRILDEKDPAPMLDLLAAWGAIRYIRYESAHRAALVAAGAAWEERLAALFKGVPFDEVESILVSFNMSKTSRKAVLGLIA